MMTISSLCSVVVVALAMTVSAGCEAPDVTDGGGAVGQVEQDLTRCELDCPTGAVFTCTTLPCTVTATTLTCNGTTTSCFPPPCQTCADLGGTCGTVLNDCGETLSCGTCGAGEQCVDNACEIASCPGTNIHCCDDQRCVTSATCAQLERLHPEGC